MHRPSNDFYKTLQVDPVAEPEVITAAYRRLADKYHPDKNKSPDALEKMQRINEAYSVLSNNIKRAQYDRERQNVHYPQNTNTASQQQSTTVSYQTPAPFSSASIWVAITNWFT